MTQDDTESPEYRDRPQSTMQISIAMDLVAGELSQQEIAAKYEVSRSTVARVAGSAWCERLRSEVLEGSVEAVKTVFQAAALETAQRLVEISKKDSATTIETARKACIDILGAAGADLGNQRAPRIEIV